MRALLCVVLFTVFGAGPALAQSCPVPKTLTFRVEKQIRRDVPGFTQGLEMDKGVLLEGTGNFVGDTRINHIDPATGKVTALMNAGKRYFGEGVTVLGDRIYQMTWRENQVFVFDRQMRLLREMKNPRDGWGLTHDGTRLIASDGSSRLFFLSPDDFRTLGAVRVARGGRTVDNLNELEYVDGAVWANIFETWEMVKINPVTGCVEATADLRPLRARMNSMERSLIDSDSNFVPNGIAYDAASGQFILTGKYWRTLFFGRFSELN